MKNPFSEYDFKEITPVVDSVTSVNVEFLSDFTYLDHLVASLCSEYNFELSRTGSNIEVAEEDLRKYFHSLLLIRVKMVRGEKFPKLQLNIPAYFCTVLSQVGLVVDTNHSVRLVPSMESFDLDVEFLNSMSTLIMQLGRLGFEYSTEMSRNKTGSWELMSSALVNDVVVTMCGSHPAYALATAILAQRGVESVLMPRVKYAPSVFIDACLRTVTKPKLRG